MSTAIIAWAPAIAVAFWRIQTHQCGAGPACHQRDACTKWPFSSRCSVEQLPRAHVATRRFPELLARRARGANAAALAGALAGASPGAAPDLWGALPALRPRLLYVAGALDANFRALAAHMAAAANGGGDAGDACACGGPAPGSVGFEGPATPDAGSEGSECGGFGEVGAAGGGAGDMGACSGPALAPQRAAACAVVAGAGHAVHLEHPEALAAVLAAFLDA